MGLVLGKPGLMHVHAQFVQAYMVRYFPFKLNVRLEATSFKQNNQ
jgi:hypothetical protein